MPVSNLWLSANLLPLLQETTAPEPLITALFIPLLVVLVLVVVNGFFVAAEFAILGARASRMEELTGDGERRAPRVLAVLRDNVKQNSYLATAQLGITIVTLGLAMYGERKLAHFLEERLISRFISEPNPALVHTIGYIITITILTYVHVVVGEMVPKSLALNSPNTMALSLGRPMAILQAILFVPIRVLNGIGNLLLRLLRIPPEQGHARLYSSEEIEQLVSESTEGGMLTEEAEEMISNIFDFSGREAGQVMTPRHKIQGIPTDLGYDELIAFVSTSRHSRFPVYEEDLDHIVGLLHLKDLIRHFRAGNEPVEVKSLLRPSPVVPYDMPVTELLAAFKRQRIHMAIVLDEYGGVAGIVTLEDLVEEIVGEVRDEFDMIETEPYVEVQPGELELAGTYLVDNLQDEVYLGDEETLPDVDTVGGLVVTFLGRPPEVGDIVELPGDIKFTVIAVEGRAVAHVRVEFPAPEPTAAESAAAETAAAAERAAEKVAPSKVVTAAANIAAAKKAAAAAANRAAADNAADGAGPLASPKPNKSNS